MRLTKFFPFLLSFFISFNSIAGDISYVGEKESVHVLVYFGNIEKGDFQKLTAAYSQVPPYSITNILMTSKGGSVSEAMRIGDFLEKNEINVVIPPGFGECLSSCVFVLAGAENKIIGGKVGIHRPYITDLYAGGEAAATSLEKTIQKIKDYLDGKGISPLLADAMFSVPPEKIKYLSEDELSRYRLNQVSYLKQEKIDIDNAKRLGISRQEYMRRKIVVQRDCSNYYTNDEKLQCAKRIFNSK